MNVKINVEWKARVPISRQLANHLERMIRARRLRAGTRLPSIRQLAGELQISRFPVIEAYDYLTCRGLVQPKHGSGYYVTPFEEHRHTVSGKCGFDDAPLDAPSMLQISNGYIPETWRDVDGIAQVIKRVTRNNRKSLIDQAAPHGEPELRRQIALRLQRIGIDTQAQQILATHSASHALDLLARALVKPGAPVLVEDPGYFNLFRMLRLAGAHLLAVPRDERGIDVAALERLLRQHRPGLFFVNSALHNPLGGSLASQTAFRILQLAERYDLTIVEDDVYADFQATPTPRLAALDQLERVIYVGGFSKTLSSSLRTGWIAAHHKFIQRLADIKVATGSTGTRLSECVIAELLERGIYRKHLERLRRMANRVFADASRNLEEAGWVLHPASREGYNLWVRVPGIADSQLLVAHARQCGIELLAGSVFRPDGSPTPWTRVSATYLGDHRALAFLEGAAQIGRLASADAVVG